MKTFLHSGDLGDIILSLPTMRALGGGTLLLGPSAAQPGQETFPRETVTPRTVKFLKSLLEEQNYIGHVKFYEGGRVDYDLNKFRYCGLKFPESNICYAHAYAHGLTPQVAVEAWIEVEPVTRYNCVVARSARHRNLDFNYYKHVPNRRAIFVGHENEYFDFQAAFPGMNVDYVKCQTALQLAQIIASAELFVGNQSFPYALAEAMKKNIILEVDPDWQDVCFERNRNEIA